MWWLDISTEYDFHFQLSSGVLIGPCKIFRWTVHSISLNSFLKIDSLSLLFPLPLQFFYLRCCLDICYLIYTFIIFTILWSVFPKCFFFPKLFIKLIRVGYEYVCNSMCAEVKGNFGVSVCLLMWVMKPEFGLPGFSFIIPHFYIILWGRKIDYYKVSIWFLSIIACQFSVNKIIIFSNPMNGSFFFLYNFPTWFKARLYSVK